MDDGQEQNMIKSAKELALERLARIEREEQEKRSGLEKKIQANPKDIKSYLELCDFLKSMKQYDSAFDALRKAYSETQDTKALFAEAQIHELTNSFNLARPIYEALLDAGSNQAKEAGARLAEFKKRARNLNEPLNFLNKNGVAKLENFYTAAQLDPQFIFTFFQHNYWLNNFGKEKDFLLKHLPQGLIPHDNGKQLAEEMMPFLPYYFILNSIKNGNEKFTEYIDNQKQLETYFKDLINDTLRFYPTSPQLKYLILEQYMRDEGFQEAIELADQIDDSAFIFHEGKERKLGILKQLNLVRAFFKTREPLKAISVHHSMEKKLSEISAGEMDWFYENVLLCSSSTAFAAYVSVGDFVSANGLIKRLKESKTLSDAVVDSPAGKNDISLIFFDAALNDFFGNLPALKECNKNLIVLFADRFNKNIKTIENIQSYQNPELFYDSFDAHLNTEFDANICTDSAAVEAQLHARLGVPLEDMRKTTLNSLGDALSETFPNFKPALALDYFLSKYFLNENLNLDETTEFINASLGQNFVQKISKNNYIIEIHCPGNYKVRIVQAFKSNSANEVKKYEILFDGEEKNSESIKLDCISTYIGQPLQDAYRQRSAKTIHKVYCSGEIPADKLSQIEIEWLCKTKTDRSVNTPRAYHTYSLGEKHIVCMEDIRGFTLEEMLFKINASLKENLSEHTKSLLKCLREDLITIHILDTVCIKTSPSATQQEIAKSSNYEIYIPAKMRELCPGLSPKAEQNSRIIGQYLDNMSTTYYRDSAPWNAKVSLFDFLSHLGLKECGTVLDKYAMNNLTNDEVYDFIINELEKDTITQAALAEAAVNSIYQIDFEKLWRKTFAADDLLFITEHPAVKEAGCSQFYEKIYKSNYAKCMMEKECNAANNSEQILRRFLEDDLDDSYAKEIESTKHFGSFLRHMGFYYYITVKKSMDPTNGTPEEHMGQAYSSLHMAVYNKEPDKENAGLKDIIELLEKADLSHLISGQ